jgi:4-hydroxy-tetrahydrodipicolinate synthase
MHTPFTDNGSVDFEAIEALVDFYEEEGVSGIFALGLTGEGATLSDDERNQISRLIAKRKSERVQLASVSNYSGDHARQIEQAKITEDTGADVVILTLSFLSTETPMYDQLADIADQVSAPLGIYECPKPVHRLIELDSLKRLADSGRFVYMKDTCRSLELLKQRVDIVRNTRLKLFPAQLGFFPESVRSGASGFCGCAANVFPAECRRIFEASKNGGDYGDLFDRVESAYGVLKKAGWPASCKLALRRRQIPTTLTCRSVGVDEAKMQSLFDDAEDPNAEILRNMLG